MLIGVTQIVDNMDNIYCVFKSKTAKNVTIVHLKFISFYSRKNHSILHRSVHLMNMSLVVRKPVFGVSDLVRHNRSVQPQKMARDLKFRI